MRYRELITNKIELIEGQIKSLHFIVNRGQPIEEYNKVLVHMEVVLSDIKSLVLSEPLSHEEGYGLQ